MITFLDENDIEHGALATIKATNAVNGERSLSGEIVTGDYVISNIERGWRLRFNDEYYVVTYAKPVDEGETVSVTFDAVHQFFWDFDKSSLHRQLSDGSHTFQAYLDFIFEGSGYSYVIDSLLKIPAFEKQSFGYKSRLSLFNDIITSTGVEFQVNGKVVRILEKVGTDLSTVVRKNFNLNELGIEKNIGDFVTYQKGFGAWKDSEDHSKGRLEVEYISPLESLYGRLEAEPLVDERYTKESSLLAVLKNNVDNSYTISVTLDIEDLTRAGYKYTQPIAGDYIMAINETLSFQEKIRIVSFTSEYDVTGQLIKHTVTCNDIGFVKKQSASYSVAKKQASSAVSRAQNALEVANRALVSANGKNSIFRGTDFPKDEPKGTLHVGDLLFLTVGDVVKQYRWNGADWEYVTGEDYAKQIKEQVDSQFAEVTQQIAEQQQAHDRTVAEILSQVDSTQSLAEQANAIGDQAKADAINLASQLSTAKTALQNSINDTKSQIATVSQALDTAKTDLQNQVNAVDAKAVKVQSDANALRTDIDLQADKILEQAQALDTAKTDLQNQVNAVDAKAVKVQSDANALRTDIDLQADKILEQAQALDTAKTDLQNQVNAVDAKAVQAQTDVDGLKVKAESIENDLNTAKTDLQNQVNTVDAKAQTLTADLNNSKNDILAQAHAQTALDSRVTTVETTANGTKETVTQLSKTVNDLSGEVTSATQSIKTVEDSIDGVYTTLSKITLGGINLFSLKNITNRTEVQSNGFYYITSQLNANAEYTVSTDIPISSDGFAIVFVFSEGGTPSTPVNGIYDSKPKTLLTDSSGNLIVAIKSKTWFDNVVNGNNHIQIETGSNASSWQPSFIDTSAELAEYKQSIDGQLTSLSQSYQTLNGQVGQNTTKIETTADSIREDLSSLQSYVDDEGTRRTEYLTMSELKTAEQIVAERAKTAKDYVAKSVYTTDVTSMRADISETKTSLNTISNRTKVVEDDLSGTKIQLASAESILNTATGNIDVLNSKSATYQTAIDGINNKFDNLRLGGGNLILNSAFQSDTNNWSGTIEVDTHPAYYNGQKTLFKIKTASGESRAGTNRFAVKRNTMYSLSFYMLAGGNVTSLDFFFLGRKAGETDSFTQTVALQRDRPNTASTLKYVTYTFNSGNSDNGYLRFDNNGSIDGNTANVYIAEIMLVEGNTPQAHQMADVEISNRIAEYKQNADQNYAGLQSTVSTLDGKVAQNKTEANQTATQLSNRLTSLETYKDGESTRAQSYFEASKTETAKQLTAERTAISANYVAKSTYNENVSGTMLKLNEIKTTADTTKQNLATYQDTVDRKLTELTTSAQTLDGKINTASTKVDAVAGQIRTEISEVEGKIPTEFGGKNLIKNGGFPTDTNNWSGTIEVDTHSKYYSGTERLFLIKATGVDEVRAATNRFSVKRDTEYTLSFYALIGNNVSSADFFFLGRQNGETDAFTQTVALQKNRLPNKANLEYITYTFDTGKSDSGYIRFDNNGSTDNYNAFMFVGEVMLVEGSTARKYEKATEEVIDEISSVKAELKLTKKGLTGYFNKTDSNASSISTHTNQISALNNALSSKVSQTDYNTLTGRVSSAETAITQNATEIGNRLTSLETYKDGESTRAQSYFEASKTETAKQLTAERTAISANYVAKSTYNENVSGTMLKLNEIKTTADTTKQNLATYQDTVDRKLTELTTSAQTLDGKINTASTKVDAVAGQIRTEISEVEGKIPTEFGGKNLIKNGGFPTDTNNWSGTIEVDTHSKYYSGTERLFLIKATGVDEVRAATNRFSVKRDTEYTLSFYALIGNNVSSADFFFLGRQNGETDAFTQTVALQKNRLPNKANLEYVTYTFDTGKSDSGYIRFDNNGSTDNYNAFMFVGEVMLVEGSTARKYEKATEEVIDEISSVKAELKLTKKGLTGYFNKTDSNASSISTHTNQISALNNALSSKVSQTDYNTLTGRVTNAESQIQIQAGEISKRLTSTQVESAITAKGYQTKAQVDSNITGRGYITSSALQPYVTTTVLENKVKETSDSFNRTISAVRLEIPTNTSMRNLILKSSDKWGSYTSTNNANSNWCPEICRITLDSDRGVTVGKKLNLFVYISADNVALDSSSLHRIDVQAYIAKKDGTNLWHGDVPFHNQWGSKTLKAGNNYYVVRLTKEIKDTVYENGAQLVVQCRIDGANHVDYRHRAAMITTGDMFPDAWSPASEDLVTVVAFNNVSDTVDHHTQTLKDQEGRINMVLQTTTTAYQLLQDGGSIYEDLKTVKGQIQQVRDANYATRIETLAGSWAVKNLTSGGQMLNQINLLANGTNLIDGRLTHITGDTLIDRGVIKSAMIGNGQIGTAHIGTIDASQANIINLNVNTLVGFDTTFIKGKFDNVIADLLKGKTIVAQNDAMNVDLLNAKINLLADSSAIRRVFNGYPTQFIKYGTMIDSNGNKFSNTIIGSNRDGSENSGNATFSGIEIFNSATTSVEDYTKIYADKLYLKHDGGDHGWLVQTSNKQRIIPLDGTIPSEIMAKDFLMIYNDNGNATSLRDHIATLVHNITELANRTGGMTNIWSIKA